MATGTSIDPQRGAKTLESWADERCSLHHVRPATKAKNRSFLDNHILPQLGGIPLALITERDDLRFVVDLTEKGLPPATVRSVTNTSSAVINAAVAGGLMVKSPRPARLRLPNNNAAAEALILTHEQVSQLVEELPGRYQAMGYLFAYSGLRWSEAAGLTRQRGPDSAGG